MKAEEKSSSADRLCCSASKRLGELAYKLALFVKSERSVLEYSALFDELIGELAISSAEICGANELHLSAYNQLIGQMQEKDKKSV